MESKLDKSIHNFHSLKIPRPLPLDAPLKVVRNEFQNETNSKAKTNSKILTKKFAQTQFDPYTLV